MAIATHKICKTCNGKGSLCDETTCTMLGMTIETICRFCEGKGYILESQEFVISNKVYNQLEQEENEKRMNAIRAEIVSHVAKLYYDAGKDLPDWYEDYAHMMWDENKDGSLRFYTFDECEEHGPKAKQQWLDLAEFLEISFCSDDIAIKKELETVNNEIISDDVFSEASELVRLSSSWIGKPLALDIVIYAEQQRARRINLEKRILEASIILKNEKEIQKAINILLGE